MKHEQCCVGVIAPPANCHWVKIKMCKKSYSNAKILRAVMSAIGALEWIDM